MAETGFNLNCPKCGTKLAFPGRPRRDIAVKCGHCGHEGTLPRRRKSKPNKSQAVDPKVLKPVPADASSANAIESDSQPRAVGSWKGSLIVLGLLSVLCVAAFLVTRNTAGTPDINADVAKNDSAAALESDSEPTAAAESRDEKTAETPPVDPQPVRTPDPIDSQQLFGILREDLETVVSEFDRGFVRYFSLVNLYNAGATESELDTCRRALAKTLNCLSWERKLVLPAAVNARKTIYRVDIRDLDWTTEIWGEIRRSDPCAFAFTSEDAAVCSDLTDDSLPVVRADWFIAKATNTPLYNSILRLPDSLSELCAKLRVDVEESVAEAECRRGGFRTSNESGLPRIVERHRMMYGSLWLAHDFLETNSHHDIFEYPMGERESSTSLQGDHVSAMFHLPNGLFAWMNFDEDGHMLSRTPRIFQASDHAAVGRDSASSCISCHSGGIVQRDDEVGIAIRTNREAYRFPDRILDVYDAADFRELQSKDQQQFCKALDEIGISDATVTAEPVQMTITRFRKDVDLKNAAAEFGLSSDELSQYIDDDASLKRKLGGLLSGTADISREDFVSCFADVGETLGLGRAVNRNLVVARNRSDDAASTPASSGGSAKPAAGLTNQKADLIGDGKATIASFDGTRVRLRLADGNFRTIEVDKLSTADLEKVLSRNVADGSAPDDLPDDGAPEESDSKSPDSPVTPARRESPILSTSKATLVKFDGASQVTMRLADGTSQTVSIDSLHADDVQFVLDRGTGESNSTVQQPNDLPAETTDSDVSSSSSPASEVPETHIWLNREGAPIIEGRIHSVVRGTHVRVAPAPRQWHPQGQALNGEFRLAATLRGGDVEVQILPEGQTRTVKVPMAALDDSDKAYLEQIRQGLQSGLLKAVRSPRLQYWELPIAVLSDDDQQYVQRMASAADSKP